MNQQKLVSVVMPTYNQAQFLGDALRSVLTQTYPALEFIVVNDGSMDATAEILAALRDPRVTVASLSRNSRLPRALNVGFALARGEYLTWTSSDNEMLPECLATLAAHLNAHPAVGLVYASHHNVGLRTFTTIKEPFNHEVLLGGRNTVGPCFMYRREVMEAVGSYDPDCFGAEDYDMWLRVAARFRVEALAEVLYVYRHHGNSITSRCPSDVGAGRERALGKARALPTACPSPHDPDTRPGRRDSLP
jgi:glycosyltransferase involved in cell wall biosynthesis